MTDELGYGLEKRRQGNLDILAGKVTFRCVLVSVFALGYVGAEIWTLQRRFPGNARERVGERALIRLLQGGAEEEWVALLCPRAPMNQF